MCTVEDCVSELIELKFHENFTSFTLDKPGYLNTLAEAHMARAHTHNLGFT